MLKIIVLPSSFYPRLIISFLYLTLKLPAINNNKDIAILTETSQPEEYHSNAHQHNQ